MHHPSIHPIRSRAYSQPYYTYRTCTWCAARPVETCKYYTLSVSHFLSSVRPSLSQLQLAYFNSAGKKGGRLGLKPGHAAQHLCGRMLQGTRHNNAKRRAASRRLVVKKTAAQRRRKEEGETKLLSISPEKMMLHITAPARSDPTLHVPGQELWPSNHLRCLAMTAHSTSASQ